MLFNYFGFRPQETCTLLLSTRWVQVFCDSALPLSLSTFSYLLSFQKFTMAGSSQFVPSLNAITTNQDLQWLVQPSLMHPPGPSRSPAPPYPTLSGARPLGPPPSHSYLLRPGVIRAAANTAASTRRRNDDHVRKQSLNNFTEIYSVKKHIFESSL